MRVNPASTGKEAAGAAPTSWLSGGWNRALLLNAILSPSQKEENRQQWTAHRQCWKGRIGEQARRKPTQQLPPASGSPTTSLCLCLWLFQRQESLSKKLSKLLPSTRTPTIALCALRSPPIHPALRSWHTEYTSSQAFSRLLVKV